MRLSSRHCATRIRGFVASLLLLLSLASCESAADVDRPESFAEDGIAFSYPGNWSVTEEAPAGEAEVRILFVESPGSALVIVSYFPRGTELPVEEFAADFHEASLVETKDLARVGPLSPFTATSGRTAPIRSVVGGVSREGVETHFSTAFAGEAVPHKFRAFKVEGDPAAAFLVVQAAEEDWSLVEPGFRLVLESFEVR